MKRSRLFSPLRPVFLLAAVALGVVVLLSHTNPVRAFGITCCDVKCSREFNRTLDQCMRRFGDPDFCNIQALVARDQCYANCNPDDCNGKGGGGKTK